MLIQRFPENWRGPQASATTSMTIGQLARLTGIPARNIRYYESCGLLPNPERTENGYRRYSQADVTGAKFARSGWKGSSLPAGK